MVLILLSDLFHVPAYIDVASSLTHIRFTRQTRKSLSNRTVLQFQAGVSLAIHNVMSPKPSRETMIEQLPVADVICHIWGFPSQ